MYKITVDVDGMACGMCEAHINDTIRKNFTIKSVKASHKKGEVEITSEKPIDEQKLREAVKETGYTVTSVTSEEFTKKHFWQK